MKAQKKGPNRNLKAAIGFSGQKQRAIATRLHIPEVRLSKIVRGQAIADERERQKLARFLGRPESELFPTPEHSQVA